MNRFVCIQTDSIKYKNSKNPLCHCINPDYKNNRSIVLIMFTALYFKALRIAVLEVNVLRSGIKWHKVGVL